MDQRFAKELISIGILSFKEQEKLWQIAKRCASSTGIPAAGAGALWGLKMGTPIPGVGTVTGPVAGALAGLVYGTVSCTMLNVTMKQELKKLANEM